jgi:hypothetical protein
MTSPFDARPDETVGRLLREHLGGGDSSAFAARVRAAIAVEADTAWDVLARWTRPGLVAAAAVALTVGLWLGIGSGSEMDEITLADAVQSAGVPEALLTAPSSSSADAVLAAIVGDQ